MIFKTKKILINNIDDFIDSVNEGALVFNSGIKDYLNGNQENFQLRIEAISALESKADRLRRDVENDLYRHSLIPEHRGDVLGLLETTDDVIDTAKETLFLFDIEMPVIPVELNQKFIDLTDSVTNAVKSLVQSARVFFRDPPSVKDHLHEVYFYEKEADVLAKKLKRYIFNELKNELSAKIQLRYFVYNIDLIADKSEAVADKLTIYVIKQTI